MSQLINPLLADIPAKKVVKSTAGFKEVSGHNAIDDVGKCVAKDCKTPTKIMLCNGIKCHVCLEHRVALPCKDE